MIATSGRAASTRALLGIRQPVLACTARLTVVPVGQFLARNSPRAGWSRSPSPALLRHGDASRAASRRGEFLSGTAGLITAAGHDDGTNVRCNPTCAFHTSHPEYAERLFDRRGGHVEIDAVEDQRAAP